MSAFYFGGGSDLSGIKIGSSFNVELSGNDMEVELIQESYDVEIDRSDLEVDFDNTINVDIDEC